MSNKDLFYLPTINIENNQLNKSNQRPKTSNDKINKSIDNDINTLLYNEFNDNLNKRERLIKHIIEYSNHVSCDNEILRSKLIELRIVTIQLINDSINIEKKLYNNTIDKYQYNKILRYIMSKIYSFISDIDQLYNIKKIILILPSNITRHRNPFLLTKSIDVLHNINISSIDNNLIDNSDKINEINNYIVASKQILRCESYLFNQLPFNLIELERYISISYNDTNIRKFLRCIITILKYNQQSTNTQNLQLLTYLYDENYRIEGYVLLNQLNSYKCEDLLPNELIKTIINQLNDITFNNYLSESNIISNYLFEWIYEIFYVSNPSFGEELPWLSSFKKRKRRNELADKSNLTTRPVTTTAIDTRPNNDKQTNITNYMYSPTKSYRLEPLSKKKPQSRILPTDYVDSNEIKDKDKIHQIVSSNTHTNANTKTTTNANTNANTIANIIVTSSKDVSGNKNISSILSNKEIENRIKLQIEKIFDLQNKSDSNNSDSVLQLKYDLLKLQNELIKKKIISNRSNITNLYTIPSIPLDKSTVTDKNDLRVGICSRDVIVNNVSFYIEIIYDSVADRLIGEVYVYEEVLDTTDDMVNQSMKSIKTLISFIYIPSLLFNQVTSKQLDSLLDHTPMNDKILLCDQLFRQIEMYINSITKQALVLLDSQEIDNDSNNSTDRKLDIINFLKLKIEKQFYYQIDRLLYQTNIIDKFGTIYIIVERNKEYDGLTINCAPNEFSDNQNVSTSVSIDISDKALAVLLCTQRGLYLLSQIKWVSMQTVSQWLISRLTCQRLTIPSFRNQINNEMKTNVLLPGIISNESFKLLDITIDRSIEISKQLLDQWLSRYVPHIRGISYSLSTIQESEMLKFNIRVIIPNVKYRIKYLNKLEILKQSNLIDYTTYDHTTNGYVLSDSSDDEVDIEIVDKPVNKKKKKIYKPLYIDLYYYLTYNELLIFGLTNTSTINETKVVLNNRDSNNQIINSYDRQIEYEQSNPNEFIWKLLNRLKVEFKGSLEEPFNDNNTLENPLSWYITYNRQIVREIRTISDCVMIITATAIDTQLLFESEPTDKQRFNKIESKLFTESDLLEIVTIEGWPSALYLCENRNILAYKVLDRLKVVIEKEKEEHRLEHVSYPETRMISVVLSIVGGENSHIDKQIGVVEINQVSTLADVRLMLKFEIDNDILPTFYSFLYKGFPCSIKQESFRRAWECLPRLHLLARHESKTSNQDANIKESESKDNNKTKKVHRRVDKSLVPTPIHSLASCSEGSSVVYLLHELNDVKEGDVIRIGHTMSRDYIVRGAYPKILIIDPPLNLLEEMEIVKPFQGFYQFPKEVEKPNEKPSESQINKQIDKQIPLFKSKRKKRNKLLFRPDRDIIYLAPSDLPLLPSPINLGLTYTYLSDNKELEISRHIKLKQYDIVTNYMNSIYPPKVEEVKAVVNHVSNYLSNYLTTPKSTMNKTLDTKKSFKLIKEFSFNEHQAIGLTISNDSMLKDQILLSMTSVRPKVTNENANSTSLNTSNELNTTIPNILGSADKSIDLLTTKQSPNEEVKINDATNSLDTKNNTLTININNINSTIDDHTSLNNIDRYTDVWLWKCVPVTSDNRPSWRKLYDDGIVTNPYTYTQSKLLFTYFTISVPYNHMEKLSIDSRISNDLIYHRINEIKYNFTIESYLQLVWKLVTLEWYPVYKYGIDLNKFLKFIKFINCIPDINKRVRLDQIEILFIKEIKKKTNYNDKYLSYNNFKELLKGVACIRYPLGIEYIDIDFDDDIERDEKIINNNNSIEYKIKEYENKHINIQKDNFIDIDSHIETSNITSDIIENPINNDDNINTDQDDNNANPDQNNDITTIGESKVDPSTKPNSATTIISSDAPQLNIKNQLNRSKKLDNILKKRVNIFSNASNQTFNTSDNYYGTSSSHVEYAFKRLVNDYIITQSIFYNQIFEKAKLIVMKKNAFKYCACTKIISIYRKYIIRKKYLYFYKQIIRIQSVIRLFLIKNYVKKLRYIYMNDWIVRLRYYSARKIQSIIRKFLCKIWLKNQLNQIKKQQIFIQKAARLRKRNSKRQSNKSLLLRNVKRINGISVLFTIKRKDMRNYTKDFSIIIYVYIPQTSQTNVYHIDELELRKYVEKDIYNIQREFPKKYIEKSKRKQPGSSVSLAELFDKQNLYHVISTRILIKQNKIPGKEVYIKFSKQALGQRGNKIFTKGLRIYHGGSKYANHRIDISNRLLLDVKALSIVEDRLIAIEPFIKSQGIGEMYICSVFDSGSDITVQCYHILTSQIYRCVIDFQSIHKWIIQETKLLIEDQNKNKITNTSDSELINEIDILPKILNKDNKIYLYHWIVNQIVIDTRHSQYRIIFNYHYMKSKKKQAILLIQAHFRRLLTQKKNTSLLDNIILKINLPNQVDNQIYYLNKLTGLSTYHKPIILGKYDIPTEPQYKWIEITYPDRITKQMVTYFVNPYTGKYTHLSIIQAIIIIQRLIRKHQLKLIYVSLNEIRKIHKVIKENEFKYPKNPRNLSNAINKAIITHILNVDDTFTNESLAKTYYIECMKLSESNPLVNRLFAIYLLSSCESPIKPNRERVHRLLDDSKLRDPNNKKFELAYLLFKYSNLLYPKQINILLIRSIVEIFIYNNIELGEKFIRRALNINPFHENLVSIYQYIKFEKNYLSMTIKEDKHMQYYAVSKIDNISSLDDNIPSNDKLKSIDDNNDSKPKPFIKQNRPIYIHGKEALTNAKWAGWVKVINDHYVVPVALSDIISKSSNKTMTSSTTYWYNPVDGTKQLDTPDFTIEWKKRLQRSYYYRSYTGLDIYYDPLTTTYFQYHSMTETFE